ncbi:MAG: transcription elongation factor Spt5 [Candidatus Pacearchaeota archaeon]
MLFVIKITTNKEDTVMKAIKERVEKKQLQVYSIIRPHGVRGYIILEAEDKDSAEEAVFNFRYVKGILRKNVTYEEIKPMIEPKIEEINIEKNDIVEIISEPFKKEKAKVVRVDKQKGEAVVVLLQAAIPIPVTISLDNLRVIRREEISEEKEENE